MVTSIFFGVQDAYQLSGPRKCLWTLNSLDAYQFWATARGLWTLNSLDAYQIRGLLAGSWTLTLWTLKKKIGMYFQIFA